jgi:hypothetical protein
VAPWPEVRCHGTIGGEESLSVPWGCESPHAVLSLAGQSVRILGTVVQIPVLPMFHPGHDLASLNLSQFVAA